MIKFTNRYSKDVAGWDKIAENPENFWNSLSSQERISFFENKFYVFKTWDRLNDQEKRRIQELAKNQADCAFLASAMEDALGYLKS